MDIHQHLGHESGTAVTINDVAQAAGVSVRTASRVLNQSPKVNAETRARVQEVIRSLNFIPNLRARALASNRSFMLGFVHDDPNAEIADQVQRGIFTECAQFGYELLVHPVDHKNPHLVEDVMSFVRRTGVDGLIVIAPVSENVDLANALAAHGTPVAAVNSLALDFQRNKIVSREREACGDIARHFIELGHTEIGVISGPLVQTAARERQIGFNAALDAAGIALRPENVFEGDWTFESGLEGARRLLASPHRPTAVYAGNDRMAAALIKVAAQAGLRVPQDLSVVGFDDSYLAKVLTPALTTITRPFVQIGEGAAHWLLTNLRGVSDDHDPLMRFYDLKLTKRESTAPPPT
ncbi:MAG TPA: LacI family DNA-binding transcriptional regulator [Steroidobacteraceae bacterium]|nr:LacI family DNA-binding transcriptional regulator [Steroidobacteraceae bacterium]